MRKKLILFLIIIFIMGAINKQTKASDFEIKSFSPTEGAIGDEITITIPVARELFPECFIPGETSYGSTSMCKFSAKVYFNNVEVIPAPNYYDFSPQLKAIVPASAADGKIKIEITSVDAYHEKSYNVTLLSSSDFKILTPSAQDDLSVRQQYLQQAKVDQAWNYSHGSSDVIVAVIDDGVYTGHPDLDNNMWINYGEIEGNGKDDDGNGYIDDKWGWNFVNNSKDMTTLGTHGTMVAGIIGSESNNSTGITGINWYIRLMPIITCDDNGCNDEAIKKAIRYAVDNGADIINLSLGGDVFNYSDNYNEVIKYAFDKNILVVVAAGNGDLEGGIGRNLDITKVSPVCNDGSQNMILGIGAVDANNQLSSWSNYGGCADVYAPGEDIVSTAVPAYSTLNGFYDSADGTSFSTPIVSGIAALIKAKYPEIKNTAVRDRIINNSDYQNGLRVINAYKAILQPFSDSEKKIDKIISTEPIATTPNIQNKKNGLVEMPQIQSSVIVEEKSLITKIDNSLSKRMNGKILLQVEKNGEGWYVYPDNKKKYYLGRPADAFGIMRNLGLGIKHSELENYLKTKFPSRLLGKIFLDVEQNGEAYYVNPDDLKGYYLGRPADAFKIMRELGLGITNNDIRKIDVGEVE
jgi:subtilisin family serine protease